MSFEALLEQLRQEYVTELPNKISDIEKSFATEQLQVVREDFHKLKGTGRTYGVPEISDLAEVMEKICVQYPSEIPRTVPEALILLKEIYAHRAEEKTVDLSHNQRFERLKKILSQ